jgi:PAS domain S-box-containing protein
MNKSRLIIVVSIAAALTFWVLDAATDYFHHFGEPFADVLLFCEKEILFRVLFSVCLLLLGISMSRSIASRKRAEEALGETEKEKAKTEAVVEAIGDALSIQDTDYTILFQNQAHKDLIGDHLGECCYEAYEQSNQVCEGCPLIMSFEDGKTHTAMRTVTIDDSILHVEITASPLRDPSGDIVGGVEVVRDVTERKRMEEGIKVSLEEKEILLREIHHRVKNNMQIILSLLNLQAKYAGHGELAGMLRDCQERIKFMALVQEKLYISSDFSSINYKDYIRSLTSSLMQISKDNTAKVSMTLELEDDFTLGIDTAIPIGLVINELVSNSLQHAFPGDRDGEITISLRRRGENDIELVIRDNGVGMPKGIDIRNSKSMGLMLVSSLSETLGRTAPGRDGDERAGGDGVYSQVRGA